MNVLSAISPDYQATIRGIEAKASVFGNTEPASSVLCGSEALADVPRIAANSAVMMSLRQSQQPLSTISRPPFETMHEIGKPTGISVCIVQALAGLLGRLRSVDIAGS